MPGPKGHDVWGIDVDAAKVEEIRAGHTPGADMPLLTGTLATDELMINEVVDRVVACDLPSVALLGLSFKASTDDLRESPNVDLADRLTGKGFDVKIYDPLVNPARLVGANRRYVEALPGYEGIGW